MTDQAEKLRMMVQQSQMSHAKVIAVISGKGGVGKSNVSLNFALSLIQQQLKVTVIDLDIGMGNLEILLGKPAKYSIVDMLERDLLISDIKEAGPGHLNFIAGGTGLSELVKLNEIKLQKFSEQLTELSLTNDYIILDLGAGLTEETFGFILAADEVFVVTTPEPTAVTDAYSMIKYLTAKDEQKPLYLLVNKVDSDKEGKQTAFNLQQVAKRFLNKEIEMLGYLPNDPQVSKAVKAQTPFIIYDQKSKVSKSLKKIVATYLGRGKSTVKSVGFVQKIQSWFIAK
ncbi:cobyrinic acid a,c-diamide synthase [Alkalihalobacillus alcalophilus ATCC 27647 = CGMCC 1.3604]|uniref:Cobyrinic acid a,c-diamide synthase n=1 Tax=Alkalihalobacillus alcalophilus ATCC 27647 = CGMCC 1.3604 TaxID=1218173 RepID=A0A094WN28_ALKAL|nr:MinD/ParA family protein [Alkalihalobacillus alcalophilus]KGA98231.1 cobyrinic acid a,c-diamide synthase [Alkalihalobacillus alcalophilus ATCC 27647 = CGMCC 1.3604]MED1562171.1 MinD/ParA family protein [Alkalihalobacillus alcalophilus]THG91396.1 cobyrinic acid a,c-diamide synthase [Alkalihalobacillus alcalophilus ATCC 27647 = CGMCC 1.3604]